MKTEKEWKQTYRRKRAIEIRYRYRKRSTIDCNAVNWDVTERDAKGKLKEIDCSIGFENAKSELRFNATRTHLTSLSEHCNIIPKRIQFVFRSFIA